jgi:hypothetical protein
MNGKTREELAVKSNDFNDELLTNTRKVQETATNIDYYVFFLLIRGITSSYRTSRSHSNTPHSVGLLWTDDQSDAETYTWHHTTLTRDKLPFPGGIRTHKTSKRAAASPRLRPQGHRDRLVIIYTGIKHKLLCECWGFLRDEAEDFLLFGKDAT